MVSMKVIESVQRPIQLWCDNSAAVFFTKNNKRSSGTKHLELKFLMVREKVKKGYTQVDYIDTQSMVADPLNKGLPNAVFHKHVAKMGLISSFDRLG